MPRTIEDIFAFEFLESESEENLLEIEVNFSVAVDPLSKEVLKTDF